MLLNAADNDHALLINGMSDVMGDQHKDKKSIQITIAELVDTMVCHHHNQ